MRKLVGRIQIIEPHNTTQPIQQRYDWAIWVKAPHMHVYSDGIGWLSKAKARIAAAKAAQRLGITIND